MYVQYVTEKFLGIKGGALERQLKQNNKVPLDLINI